jgi:hypothetical protein
MLCPHFKNSKENHRMRKFRGLFGMENASFHSGYWMEHEVYRGVVIVLLGGYDVGRLGDTHIMIPSATGLFFKVLNKVQNFKEQASSRRNHGVCITKRPTS